jgi:2-dehydro-3-deoxyphosphooctonate aldolase (KDO 8-P synthase)
MRALGWPVVYDATHSLQQPGGESSGGRASRVPADARGGRVRNRRPVLRDPSRPGACVVDAATQLPLADAGRFLDEAKRVHEAVAGVRETVSR